MSYILEALKKAQAERQLGALPTIHAPPPQGLDAVAAGRYTKPLWLALGLMGLLVLALLAWRQPWQGGVAPAAPQPSAPFPVVPAMATVALAPAPTRPPPPRHAPRAVATEDPILSLRELPEPIQRQIAPLAIGGYIYSKNPADRLLLVDKVLRREGEELGPGLTLEKLQPKSAVFNFNGYRYRVPY